MPTGTPLAIHTSHSVPAHAIHKPLAATRCTLTGEVRRTAIQWTPCHPNRPTSPECTVPTHNPLTAARSPTTNKSRCTANPPPDPPCQDALCQCAAEGGAALQVEHAAGPRVIRVLYSVMFTGVGQGRGGVEGVRDARGPKDGDSFGELVG